MTDFIRAIPRDDDREWDCQCARCGSSAAWRVCEHCGGEGFDGHDCGEDCCCCMYPEDNVPCYLCDGNGGEYWCMSSREWCESHPLGCRESVNRGEIEWFPVERATA